MIERCHHELFPVDFNLSLAHPDALHSSASRAECLKNTPSKISIPSKRSSRNPEVSSLAMRGVDVIAWGGSLPDGKPYPRTPSFASRLLPCFAPRLFSLLYGHPTKLQACTISLRSDPSWLPDAPFAHLASRRTSRNLASFGSPLRYSTPLPFVWPCSRSLLSTRGPVPSAAAAVVVHVSTPSGRPCPSVVPALPPLSPPCIRRN